MRHGERKDTTANSDLVLMCYRRTGQCTPTNLSQCGRWSVLARVWRSAVVRVSCSGNLFPGERRSLRRQPGRQRAALTFRRPVASASPSRRLPAGLLAAAADSFAMLIKTSLLIRETVCSLTDFF